MPAAFAIGNSSGPNSTIAGIPSSTEPRKMNMMIDSSIEPGFAAGRVAEDVGELLREARLRERPAHRGRGRDDQQDRAGERHRLDERRVERAPFETAVDQHADEQRVDDADDADLGRGRDALDHEVADHQRQNQSPGSATKNAVATVRAWRALRQRRVLALRVPQRDGDQQQRDDERGQQAGGEHRRGSTRRLPSR